MLERKDQPGSPKSLADVLEEELEGETRSTTGAEFDEAEEQKRLTEVYRRIHALEIERSALCLSGGGIRSASFGLGVLQALARARLLDKFDYLSTVSGGGYIGASMVAAMTAGPAGTATAGKSTPRANAKTAARDSARYAFPSFTAGFRFCTIQSRS